MYRQALLTAALVLAALPAAAQPIRLGVDLELERDDNFTRGPLPADQRSDTRIGVGGAAVHSVVLGPRSGLILRGGARYAHQVDFGDTSHLALSGSAAWRIQPVVGFSTPWIELAGELQWLRHADSELRDGSIASLTASVGSYVTDRLRLSAGAGADRRSGDSTGLYDLSTTRLFATVDLRVGERATLYGRIARVAGDHVFTAVDPTSQGWLIPISEVIVSDPALASGFSGAAPAAYRLEATTLVYDLGINYPLFGAHTLDFSLTHYASETDRDARKYDATQLRAAYLYRFQ
ncbi:MAG: hypothetical protein ACT4P3_05560 [Betaproteobacteria bacterium]